MAEVTPMPAKHRRRAAKSPALATVGNLDQPAQSAPKPDLTQSPAPETPKPKPDERSGRGRPAKSDGDNQSTEREAKFWKNVKAIAPEDWGTRAFIYVYATEPICEPGTFGKYNYLVRSSQAITDLQQLLEDYGSFKGYMTLNFRKPAARESELLDTLSFHMYNPKYPPKLPPSAWVNDPRNKKWAELLPKEKPVQPQSNGADPAKMFETFLTMQDRIEQRYSREEPEPPPDPADQFQTVVSTAKDLLQMAQPKSDDGFQKFLLTELAEERRANRELMTELLKSKTAAPVGASDPLDMFDKMMDRVDKIKERVAPEQENSPAHHSRMNGWQEFGLELLKGIFNSPTAANLSQGFIMWAAGKNAGASQPGPTHIQQHMQPQPNGAPQMPPQGIPAGTPGLLSPQQLAQAIGPQIIQPVWLHLTDKEKDGYDLADWVIAGRGKDAYEFLKAHGPETIMEAFKLSPYWQQQGNGAPGLSSVEGELSILLDEFCSWPPPDDDGAEGEPIPTDPAEQDRSPYEESGETADFTQ